MFAFGISFVVIGLFWMGHHSLCRYIAAFDRALIGINLLFLGIIAFLPYPTGLLSGTNGRLAWAATVFYAACIAAAGLAELAIWRYAIGKDLLRPEAPPMLRREVSLRLLVAPVVFLLSIPMAFYSPNLATYCWLVILAANGLLSRWRPEGGSAKPAEGLSGRVSGPMAPAPGSVARGRMPVRRRPGRRAGCLSHGTKHPGLRPSPDRPGRSQTRLGPAMTPRPAGPGRPARTRI